MGKITVVGMGPGTLDFMTIKSLEILKAAPLVLLRTARHPVVKPLEDLGCRFESYDGFYEQHETFDEVYGTISELVLGRKKGRTDSKVITIFDSTGIAIEDIAVARLLFERAQQTGCYPSINLIGT